MESITVVHSFVNALLRVSEGALIAVGATESLTWWLILELTGVVAFPIVFLLFRFLPDRGYAFSKIVGLLLVSYLLWLGASVHLIPNERWSIVLILTAIAGVSSVLAWRWRSSIADFLRERWGYVLFVELLFTFAFFFALSLRAQALGGDFQFAGEKLWDNALINALVRADYFPPEDPWLAGHSINYYYFGHLPIATLTTLSGIASDVTFNLGLALLAALSVSGAFGLVYNLIGDRAKLRTAVLFALLGPVFLLVSSNLAGLFELLSIHGVGSEGFYRLVGIHGLDGATASGAWYPTDDPWVERATEFVDGQAGDWWFPFAQFALGELHSNILPIPLVLLVMGLALNTWRSAGAAMLYSWLMNPLYLAFTALALGAVAFAQVPFAPALAVLLILVFVLRGYLSEGGFNPVLLGHTLAFAGPLVALAVLFYLPFYLSNAGAPIEIRPVEGGVQPNHLLIMWLPFLWLTGSLAIACLNGLKLLHGVVALALMLIVTFVMVAPWLLSGSTDLTTQITIRTSEFNGNWLSLLILFAVLLVTVLALISQLAQAKDAGTGRGTVFALSVGAIAVLLLIGVEFYDIRPHPFPFKWGFRVKAGFAVWFLMSISSAFAVYYLVANWKVRGVAGRIVKATWATLSAVILLAGLVYPVLASFSLTDGFTSDRQVDLLWQMERSEPAQHEAIEWLRDNVEGTPVILEAVRADHLSYARISAYTGLPTVLGQPNHEAAFRASWEPQSGRKGDIELAYKTSDPAVAETILDKYNVEYVYADGFTASAYGEVDLSKFRTFMDIVFQSHNVTIYKRHGD